MLSSYLLAVFQYLRAGDDRLIHTPTLDLTLCYLNESTISQVVDDVFDILLVIADRLTCQRVAVDEDFLLLLFYLVILSDVDDIIRYPRKQPCVVRICNFAFFSGLIGAQFWAERVQPKSPELDAKLLVSC